MIYSFEQLQQKVETTLQEIDFKSYEPKNLYEPVHYILSIGGKRIRPVALLMGCNLFCEEIAHALHAAVGIEVFHNFTLLHDDIMDNSPVRRNHPTVHVKWNKNTAILSGDAMYALAFDFLLKTPHESSGKILSLFSKTAIAVCEGQQLDLDFESLSVISEKQYLKMIELKTSVLLATAFKIGAILGGADDMNANLLYRIGLNIGLAFQIQDDLLDSFGDPIKLGKIIGSDILVNKKTFLMVKAMETASEKDVALLQKLFSVKKFEDSEKISKVKEIFLNAGVKEMAKEKIENYFTDAIQSLQQIDLSSERKKTLFKLITLLGNRNF